MGKRKLSLRELQLLELEIAKEIKRICEKNNIRYFIFYGTLLGAVRHGGFIPWDDDMDIGMPYKDYQKFMKIAELELSPRFRLQHWNDGSHYAHPYMKVKMVGTTVMEIVNQNVDTDKGIWVDIFPFYPMLKSEAESSSYRFMLKILEKICLIKNGYDLNIITNSRMHKMFNLSLKFFPLPYPIAKCILIRQIEKKCTDKAECWVSHTASDVIPVDCLEHLVPLAFENSSFLAPSKYHELLTNLYGDYMSLPSLEEQNKGHSILYATIDE